MLVWNCGEDFSLCRCGSSSLSYFNQLFFILLITFVRKFFLGNIFCFLKFSANWGICLNFKDRLDLLQHAHTHCFVWVRVTNRKHVGLMYIGLDVESSISLLVLRCCRFFFYSFETVRIVVALWWLCVCICVLQSELKSSSLLMSVIASHPAVITELWHFWVCRSFF